MANITTERPVGCGQDLANLIGAAFIALHDAQVTLEQIASSDGLRPGHIAYLMKAEQSERARRCLNRINDTVEAVAKAAGGTA